MIDAIDGPAIRQGEKTQDRYSGIWDFSLFLRMVSLLTLVVSIFLWARMLGFHGDDIQKLFEKNNFEGIVTAVVAIAMPLLCVGLWLGMSWGVILWALVGGGLTVLHFSMRPLPAELYILGLILCFLLAFYCIGLGVVFLIARRQAAGLLRKGTN